MKVLIKKAFSIVGLGVHRLNPPQSNTPKKPVVLSPLHHNSKEGLEAFYSDTEAVKSYLDPAFYDRLIDLLGNHGVDYDHKRIADVGCGIGGLLKALNNRFTTPSLTGFEYSEKALAVARAEVPGVEFSSFDVYEGTDRRFDVIFCIEVIEHLLHPDKALRNVLGMLERPGVALVTVPNGRVDTFDGHINFWSPESWKVFLDQTCQGHDIKTGLMEEGQTNYAVISRK